MAKYFTADKETGCIIDEVYSIEEGKRLIAEYEQEDKMKGAFNPNFYDVVNIDRISVL